MKDKFKQKGVWAYMLGQFRIIEQLFLAGHKDLAHDLLKKYELYKIPGTLQLVEESGFENEFVEFFNWKLCDE